MDQTGQKLLKLMFNEGESVCVSPNQFGYHSIPIDNIVEGRINLVSEDPKLPLRQCDSSELLLLAINPIRGFRKDANVQKYRSFLFECDTGSTKEQLGYFKHLGVPLSAQIFSGNKSVHSLVVLDTDGLDEKTYRLLYVWALSILTMCDQACKNASRSIRIPGTYREPGKKQRLIWMGERVKLENFMAWLNRFPHLRPQAKPPRKRLTGEPDYGRLSPWARKMLKDGINFKTGRNQGWHGLAYDFALAGFSQDQATEILLSKFEEEHDFKEKELTTCINSAFKTVEEEK